jgi:DNA-binding XRE family transcriptional regulator
MNDIDRQRQAVRNRFGARLRELRSARGIWQNVLAAAAGISSSAVSRIEKGVADPALSQAVLIVDRLRGVSSVDLMLPDNKEKIAMALGPGKYDDVCTMVREQVGIGDRPGGAIVIVIGGNRGQGFSVQADLATTVALPEILENIASAIRLDMERT